MTERNTQGIRRTVLFTPWCRRCPDWEPAPLSLKGDASYVLARHNLDTHGGTPRIGGDLTGVS